MKGGAILFFTIFIIVPLNISNATGNLNSATTTEGFKNEKITGYSNYHFPYNPHYLHNPHSYQIKDKNIIEIFTSTIEFISKNIWGFIFLIWVVISIRRAIHNRTIKKKYKRNNNKYEVKRNIDEGDAKDRNTIYLVCKNENEEEKIEYHHIVNMYTLVRLGYTRPSKKDDDCFSSSKDAKYKMGENIIVYNITFDFKNIDNSK